MQKPILVSWSGGKDCVMALNSVLKNTTSPVELFTTLNKTNKRIAMHGVVEDLLDLQADSLGLKLHKIYIPDPCSNQEYVEIMKNFMLEMKTSGATKIVFGDLFLTDIRKYREDNLAGTGIKADFPLWEIPTSNLALEFLRNGFKAIISCVDTAVLCDRFSGRIYDLDFIGELPVNVDPCGENGEFHSFVFDGPLFKFPVRFKTGKNFMAYERFCYTELTPENEL